MKADLAKESTTLPEGIVITVARCQNQHKHDKQGKVFTELRAERGEEKIMMRCDSITPNNLAQYLKLCVYQIRRIRTVVTKDCAPFHRDPHDIGEFVGAMVDKKMFDVMEMPVATQ